MGAKILSVTLMVAALVGTYYMVDSVLEPEDIELETGFFDIIKIVTEKETGTPHVFAKSKPAAWYGLGWVHARDRLWQLTY